MVSTAAAAAGSVEPDERIRHTVEANSDHAPESEARRGQPEIIDIILGHVARFQVPKRIEEADREGPEELGAGR